MTLLSFDGHLAQIARQLSVNDSAYRHPGPALINETAAVDDQSVALFP
jgi:hypothetical protein